MGESGARRRRHEGGLYQKQGYLLDRRTGAKTPYTYWQAARDVPADFLPDGVARKRITGSGRSQAEARKRLDENYAAWLAKRSELATAPAPRRRYRNAVTVSEWFVVWHEHLRYTGLSDTMWLKYRQTFRDHIEPHLGEVLLNDLNDDQINLLLYNTLLQPRELPPLVEGAKPREMKPLGASARRRVHSTLSQMVTYALQKKRLTTSPFADVKRPQVVKPVADTIAIAAQAQDLMQQLKDNDDPDYCRMLMQYLGLRQSERLGLSWSRITDLDGDTPILTVDQQLARHERIDESSPRGYYIKPSTKTGVGRQIVIPEPFISALRNYRKTWLERQEGWRAAQHSWKADHAAWRDKGSPRGQEPKRPGPQREFADLIFLREDGGLITPKQDTADWHHILDRHGLPYWRGHLNRHITATLLANLEPAPPESTVRSILGHETEAMLHYYAQIETKKQAGPMKAYGATFSESKSRPPTRAKRRR